MMDEGKPPRELIIRAVITIAALFVPLVLFPKFNSVGIAMILGIATFLFVFSIINKQVRKQEKNEFLENDLSWFRSKHKLSKEIP